MVANQFHFISRPAFNFGGPPTNRQTMSSQSHEPTVNGIPTIPPAPTSAFGPPLPVLADLLIQLHSTGLAAEMFLQAWDQDRERAASFIRALLYSDNPGRVRVLDSLLRAILGSHENSFGELTNLLASMRRN